MAMNFDNLLDTLQIYRVHDCPGHQVTFLVISLVFDHTNYGSDINVGYRQPLAVRQTSLRLTLRDVEIVVPRQPPPAPAPALSPAQPTSPPPPHLVEPNMVFGWRKLRPDLPGLSVVLCADPHARVCVFLYIVRSIAVVFGIISYIYQRVVPGLRMFALLIQYVVVPNAIPTQEQATLLLRRPLLLRLQPIVLQLLL